MEQIKDIPLGLGEFITSYDILALSTSVPVAPVLNIDQKKLEQDQDLHFKD